MSTTEDFIIENGVLKKYNGKDENVVIPDGVTSIGDYAFYSCDSLASITIPEGVTSIGNELFSSCHNLVCVIIPNSVTSIGNDVFSNCKKLRFNLYDNGLYLGNESNPYHVFIKATNKKIDGCTIHENCKIIYSGALRGCSSLTSIIIPDSVISIKCKAFSGCSGLTGITIPNSVMSIGNGVFSGCDNLQFNSYKNGLYLGNESNPYHIFFKVINNEINSCTIHENCKIIYSGAFRRCSGLTSVIIPDSVISIVDGAFSCCKNLTSVAMPNSVQRIGESAFENCKSLTSITIPNSVKSICSNTFSGCSSLISITIPNHVTRIGDSAFSGCSSLISITIPNHVTRIGDSAFSGCSSLISITIPNHVTRIEAYTFNYCSSLTSIVMPEGVLSIGEKAFEGCGNLKSITIPDSITWIRGNAFLGCDKLEIYPYLFLLYGSKDMDDCCLPVLNKQLEKSVNSFINILKRHNETAYINKATEFVLKNKCKISQGTINLFYETIAKSKARKSIALIKSIVVDVNKNVKSNIKHNEESNDVIGTSIEKFCSDNFTEYLFKQSISKAKLSHDVFENVLYKNSDKYAPAFVVKCAVVPYMELLKARPREISRYKTGYIEVSFLEKSDKIADELDSKSFLQALDKIANLENGYEKAQCLIPYCRFGNAEQIKNLISKLGEWENWWRYGTSGRSAIMIARGAIMLSDTREAMLYIEKSKCLDYYAKLRETSADVIRDCQMADFGLDNNCKKTFDLGNFTLDLTVNKDLTISLFNNRTGKVAKSVPKQGVDPDRYESVKNEFTDLKKNIKKVIKARNDILFEKFLDGSSRIAKDWVASYVNNPVLHKVAELIVWAQNKKTFILSDKGPIDCSGMSYTIDENVNIKVAHPCEMDSEEVSAWQLYFTKNGLKQPFAQVWEPVINPKNINNDRYSGVMIPYYRFYKMEKHGINVNNPYDDVDISFEGIDANVERIDYHRHHIEMSDRFEIKSFKIYGKYNKLTNHIVGYLDRITIYDRIKNDDESVIEQLPNFTLAQIMDFISVANENKAVKVGALLLEYKNKHFADFNPMDEFILE